MLCFLCSFAQVFHTVKPLTCFAIAFQLMLCHYGPAPLTLLGAASVVDKFPRPVKLKRQVDLRLQ